MIRIITDSVASIPEDMLEGTGVQIASLYVNRDGVEYLESAMDLDEFYKEINQMLDDIPTSSQPSQLVLTDMFERAAAAGDEVLGIFISSKLSGTYESAVRIAREVKSHNIDFNYALIDSSSCGFDEAWPVFEAVDAVKQGLDLDACVKAVLKAITCTRFLFTPETLTFLNKGGRIGSAAAMLGNLIQLSPVLSVRDGGVITVAKIRTRKKALERIMAEFKEDVEKHGLKNIVVHYIGDKTPAVEWAKNVVEPYVGKPIRVLPVSPVIGLHVGPAVGMVYECKRAIKNKFTGSVQTLVCTK